MIEFYLNIILMERGESPVKTFLRYFIIFSIGYTILQDFYSLGTPSQAPLTEQQHQQAQREDFNKAN
jgi:hypothetical protein